MVSFPSKGLTARSASPDSVFSRSAPPKKKPKPRNKRIFDPSKYSTRFIALKIAYLGQKYNGFEYHANNTTPLPTVEEVLWRALVKTKLIFKSDDEPLSWDGCEYSKCGRTDKGVSAFGQVIGLRVRSNRPKSQDQESAAGTTMHEFPLKEPQVPQNFDHIQDELPYPHLLNRVLPPNIRVLAWCPDPPSGFSARFSCRQRKYRYFFTQPAGYPAKIAEGATNPWQLAYDGWLDVEAMSVTAKKFEGLHDFRNFCKQDPSRQITNFERRIDTSEVVAIPQKLLGLPFLERNAEPSNSNVNPEACLYSFNVSGSAFLWHQVRHLIAILFLVGQGLEKPSVVDELLDIQKTPHKPMYDMASDQPLVLWDCVFPDEDADQTLDSLKWVYPGDQRSMQARYQLTESFGEGRFGPHGITEILWEGWHQSKINEALAGELLNLVASMPASSSLDSLSKIDISTTKASARLFNGSGKLLSKGQYIPIMDRDRTEAPDVLNARWLETNRAKAKKGRGTLDIPHMDVDE